MLARQKKKGDPEFPKEGYDPEIFQEKCKVVAKTLEILQKNFMKRLYLLIPFSIGSFSIFSIITYATYIILIIIYAIFDQNLDWNIWIEVNLIIKIVFLTLLSLIIFSLIHSMYVVYRPAPEKPFNPWLYWIPSIFSYFLFFLKILQYLIYGIYYTVNAARRNPLLPQWIWVLTAVINWVYFTIGFFLGLAAMTLFLYLLYTVSRNLQMIREYQQLEEDQQNKKSGNIAFQRNIVNLCTKHMRHNPFNVLLSTETYDGAYNPIKKEKTVVMMENVSSIYIKSI